MLHSKRSDILKEIRTLLQCPLCYLETEHAKQRMRERVITRQEVWHVLVNGWREPRKDTWSEEFNEWKYAMRGTTLDGRVLRVIMAVVNSVIVITAMEIDVERSHR
jgi:hypothetical protein